MEGCQETNQKELSRNSVPDLVERLDLKTLNALPVRQAQDPESVESGKTRSSSLVGVQSCCALKCVRGRSKTAALRKGKFEEI